MLKKREKERSCQFDNYENYAITVSAVIHSWVIGERSGDGGGSSVVRCKTRIFEAMGSNHYGTMSFIQFQT